MLWKMWKNGPFLILLLASPGAALDTDDIRSVEGGSAVETEDDRMAAAVRDRLASDPDAAWGLAERILRSRMGPKLVEETDPVLAGAQLKDWVLENPEDAAHLAVGFAKDDAMGNTDFEDSLFERVSRYFELNPGRHKGILGRLDRAVEESKSLGKIKDLGDEDRRSLLKRFFEGDAFRPAGKVTETEGGGSSGPGGPPPADAPAAYAGGALYDRISAANPTGYSAQVLALQNALNNRRPPGAPELKETGRLDHETLRYPYYGLLYDVGRLRKDLEYHRAWALAQLAGEDKGLSPERLRDPKLLAELEKRAGGKPLDPAFERRRAAILRAQEALNRFDAEAAKAKDPRKITPALLASLSALRREAARWIAVAAQEERLQRLRVYGAFLTPFLRSMVESAPAAPEERAKYLARGEALAREIAVAVKTGEVALKLLYEGTPRALAEADDPLERTRQDAKRLPAQVEAYRETLDRLHKSRRAVSRLRAWLEPLLIRWLPGSDAAKKARKERAAEASARAAFRRVADAR